MKGELRFEERKKTVKFRNVIKYSKLSKGVEEREYVGKVMMAYLRIVPQEIENVEDM